MEHKIVLVGHAGKDPETHFTSSGVQVTDFSLATSKKWTDGAGVRREETIWWKVSCWRGLAEIAQKYVQKGGLVKVEGALNVDPSTGAPRIWTDRDGNPRCSLEVNARELLLLGSRGSSGPRDEDIPAEADEF